MPRPDRTVLTQLRSLDPARGVSSDEAHLQTALAAVRGRIEAEAEADTDAGAAVVSAAACADPALAGARVRRAVPGRGWWPRTGLAAGLTIGIVVGGVWAGVELRPGQASSGSTPSVTVASPDASNGVQTPTAYMPIDASIITFAAGSGYRAAGVNVDPGVQSVDVTRGDSPGQIATVSVTRSSETTPAPVVGREPVDLGGGVIARWTAPAHVEGGYGPPQPDLLSWQSDGYAFAVRAPFSSGDADVVAVAGAVRLGGPTPVRVPVAVPSLPPGWQQVGLQTTSIGVEPADPQTGFVSVLLDVSDTAADGNVDVADLTLDVRALGIKGDDERGTAVTIDGREWRWDPNGVSLTWHGPDLVVSIGPSRDDGAQAVTQTELTSFATRLKVATSFQDTSTWFDASAAFHP